MSGKSWREPAFAAPVAEEPVEEIGQPLSPVRDPLEVLRDLPPHHSAWRKLEPPRYGYWRPKADERLYRLERGVWERVLAGTPIEPGSELLRVRRRPAGPMRGTAAAPVASAMPEPLSAQVREWPPGVSIHRPLPTLCEHRTRCGCLHGPQELSQNRDILWRQGQPWLKVSGWAERAERVRLEWQGPTAGSESLVLDPRQGGWETLIPVQAGDYRLRAVAEGPGGQAECSQAFRLIGGLEIVEWFYEPAANRLIGLTRDQLDDLLEDDRRLNDAVAALHRARREARQEAIGDAAARLQGLLGDWGEIERLVNGDPSASGITEVWRVRGAKWTYVRSRKLRNHWRRYGLAADLRNRSLLARIRDADGRPDFERLRRYLKRQVASRSPGLDVTMLEAEWGKSLQEWSLRELGVDAGVLVRGEQGAVLTTDAEAQLMRLSAGVGLEAGVDPNKGEVALHAKARGEFALLEARGRLEAYFPGEDGHALKISLPLEDGRRQTVDLGAVRARLGLGVYGFAGVSVGVSADLEFGLEQGQVRLRGVTDPGSLRRRDPGFEGMGAGADAFAGVRLGCQAEGQLEWDNPHDRANADTPDWRELAGLGADVNFNLGAGAEGGFTISYQEGKFYIRARASAVLGMGCGGDLAFTVHVQHIYELVAFVFEQLRRHDFDRLQFMTEMSFEILYRLFLFEVWRGERLVDMYEAGYQSLTDWWFGLTRELKQEAIRQERARHLAERILARPEILRWATPEARGQMLAVLCQTSLFSFEERQEDAILLILSTLQSLRDYHETLEHLTIDASRISVAEGERRLHQVMDGSQHYAWHRLVNRLRLLEQQLPRRSAYDLALAGPELNPRGFA